MSRRPVIAALLSTALLSACGTGLQAKTYQEIGRQDGAVADLGGATGIAVRHLHVEPPASGSALEIDGNASVTGGLVNNGSSADALVGASSEAARDVTLLVDGTPTTEVAIPAGGATPTTWSLSLTGLTRAVHAATYISVTLEFQRAGRVTLQVPVYAGDNGLGDREAAQDPYAE